MTRWATATLLLLLLVACGDADARQRTAVVGTWEERPAENAKFLRDAVSKEPDAAKREAWYARVARLEKSQSTEERFTLTADGRVSWTGSSKKTYEGTWTYHRGSVELRLPPNVNAVDHAEQLFYRWNGTRLWISLTIPVEGGGEDSMPVLYFRAKADP